MPLSKSDLQPAMENVRILHLEDSENDAALIERLLKQTWPACRIQRVSTRADYNAAIAKGDFDIILSDYAIPGFDGPSALTVARGRWPDRPFIFVSGTIGEERAIEVLKLGAVDYVLKDRPNRLISAIRQALALRHEAERRERSEEQLRQHQERFRLITENVADRILLLDTEGRILYHNPAYAELRGPGSFADSDAFAMVHVDDREFVRANFRRTVETGAGGRAEYRVVPPRGRIRHIEAQSTAIRDEAGRVASILVVSRDISERREAEARLREQAALLDKARDAIIATDLDHNIAYWNPSAERLYGWKSAEVFGRRLEELNLGFDAAKFEAARRQLFESGEWRGDFRLRTKTGGTVHVESTWSLVNEANGAPRSILFIDTDVTERKKLESQLLRAQRMESVGMLAGGVAHDLNNVLTPILMAVELLKMRLANEDDRRLLGNVEASAQHGAALVRQLLAFARGGEVKRTVVAVERVFDEVKRLLRQALPRTITLDVSFGKSPWAIEADPTQISQVLMNLCINARDAMPEGGRLRIATENRMVDRSSALEAEPGPYLHISVADTGIGIPEDIVDKIFDPFFTTKASRGTGLGLSTVAGIVKNHGGFMNVESEVGKGTTFHLFFPALTRQDQAAKVVPAVLPRETVLLVEDEECLRQTLVLLLEHAGYRVLVASGGAEAVAVFKRERESVSLVLTDMKMPGMSGADVISALREIDPRVRIIAMSAFMQADELKKLPFPGAPVEFLSKPLTADLLLAAVRGSAVPAR